MQSNGKAAAEVTDAGTAEQRTEQAADRIRELIANRTLLPGEKVHQVDLATKIGVSRSPLREALRTLESEGVVAYIQNRGYVVARLDSSELAQIYRMRDLLEDDLLRSIRPASGEEIAALNGLNNSLAVAADAGNVTEMLRINRQFHFDIFALSPSALLRKEIQRLWQVSEGYRATYLGLPATRSRITSEHREITRALADHDTERLVLLSSDHRRASKDVVVGLLGPAMHADFGSMTNPAH